MNNRLNQDVLEQLFLQARSHTVWQNKAVTDEQLRELYDLARWAPTSMNCLPMRLVFARSDQAKEKLRPALAEGNVDKTLAAPVTAIVAYDMQFYDQLPKLFPHMEDARAMYAGNAPLGEETAFRNGSLQGAYLILAARSLGLDIGAMSGFDNGRVDEDFFPDGQWKSNFLMNIGYGDHEKLHARGPRLEFSEACEIH